MKTVMSKHLRTLRVVAPVFTVVAANIAVAQTRTEPTLDRLAAEFQAAYNRGDVDLLGSFHAEDAVTMPPNRPMTHGRAAIAARLGRNLESDPRRWC